MSEPKNNAAKYAFLYLLSLVALGFVAVGTGMVVFQIINKYITVAGEAFDSRYSSEALRFALASLIIATPIYYLSVRKINQSLFNESLDKDSGVRRWLSYLILLIASVVSIGYLIGLIFNFLNGELTLKFGLKALSALIIAAVVFSYYFYDVKREVVSGVKNKMIAWYGYITLLVVLVTLIAGFVFVESPAQARRLRQDQEVVGLLQQADSAIYSFYQDKEKLPADWNELLTASRYLSEKSLLNPVTQEQFVYNVKGKMEYELCTTFQTKSEDTSDSYSPYYYEAGRWEHEAGYQCLTQKVDTSDMEKALRPIY